MESWRASVAIMNRVEGKHPQKTCEGMQNYPQQEWGFMQHGTLGIGQALQPVEDELRDAFLPSLLKGPCPRSMVYRSPV